jgi:hypothetical protein
LLQRSQTRVKIQITTTGLTRSAKTATRIGKQIGLAGLAGLDQTAAWINGQIRLAELTGLAGLTTRSRKMEVESCC